MLGSLQELGDQAEANLESEEEVWEAMGNSRGWRWGQLMSPA